jgi:sporulation protein YlmC with PRC-barrel domain
MVNHRISGIAISKGIVIGKVKRLDFDKNQSELRALKVFDSEIEKAKFAFAKKSLIWDSERIINTKRKSNPLSNLNLCFCKMRN